MIRISKLALLLCVYALAGCKSANAPSNFAQLAGSWNGTLESSNWNTMAVLVDLTQAADTITGTWASTSVDANGNITGTVTKTQFTGSFTISTPSLTGSRCLGTASFSGAASTTATTLTWTSPAFTGSNCSGMPLGLTLLLRK